MFGGVVSVSGFPNPKMLEPVQHGYAIVVEKLMGVALRLKDVSSCQHGVDKVRLRPGIPVVHGYF